MLFADVLERRFPNDFKRIMIEISFNCIYAFSRLQILFSQTNILMNKYIDSNPTLSRYKNELKLYLKPVIPNMNEFIRDGKPIKLYTSTDSKYDFEIISWYNTKTNCIDKRIIHNKEENNIDLTEIIEFKFMLIEFKIGETKIYKINLKTDEYNYYLIGNKFTKEFFIYYLNQYLNIDEFVTDNDDKFMLKIIDQNVNTFELEFTDKNESIELEKNEYK